MYPPFQTEPISDQEQTHSGVGLVLSASENRNKKSMFGRVNVSALRLILLTLVYCCFAWYGLLRVWKVHNHATTLDDIGVINNYLLAQESHNIDSLRARIYNPAKELYHSSGYRSMRFLDQIGLLEPGQLLSDYLFKTAANPRYSGYAPAQYLLGAWLITGNETYSELKFWGRIPSVIASVLVLGLIPLVARRLNRNHFNAVPLLAMVLLACSWQQFQIARQMYPAAIGCLGCLLLILRLTYITKFKHYPPTPITEGLMIIVLVLFNYKMLILIPGYLTALLLYANANAPTSWRVSLAIRTTLIVVAVLGTYALFVNIHPNETYHWNAGRWGEYHYQWPDHGTFLSKLGYTFSFLFKNGVVCAGSMLGFVPWGAPMYIFGILSIVMAGIGLWGFSKQRHVITHAFTVFILVTAFTWFLMVLTGLENLSPTRSTSLFAPIMALLVSNGFGVCFFVLADKTGIGKYNETFKLVSILAVSIPIVLVNGIYYRYMRYEWSDPFVKTRDAIGHLQKQYPSPILLQCNWTANGKFLWYPESPFKVYTMDQHHDYSTAKTVKQLVNKPAYIYVMSSSPITDLWRYDLKLWLQESKMISPDYEPAVVASHEIKHNERTEYYPISSASYVGAYLLVVALK